MPAPINELIQMRDAAARWNAHAPELLRVTMKVTLVSRISSGFILAMAIFFLVEGFRDRGGSAFIDGVIFSWNMYLFLTNIYKTETHLRHLKDQIHFMATQQKDLSAAIQEATNENSENRTQGIPR